MNSTSLRRTSGYHAEFWAIVPAAGRSRRMGCFKPLLPWPPVNSVTTVIESTLASLLQSDVRGIVLVLGHRKDEIIPLIRDSRITITENQSPDLPMSSSVRIAMPLIPSNAHILILPGDHPSIKSTTINRLIDVHRLHPDAIHLPVFGNVRGHPAIFPNTRYNDLLHINPDHGLRPLLHRFDISVINIPVDDPGVCLNLDYPTDYNRESDRHESHDETDI